MEKITKINSIQKFQSKLDKRKNSTIFKLIKNYKKETQYCQAGIIKSNKIGTLIDAYC